MESMNTEKIIAYLDEGQEINRWLDEKSVEISEDESYVDVYCLIQELYEAVKDHHEVFYDDEPELAKVLSKGVIFGFYACGRHYLIEDSDPISDSLVMDSFSYCLNVLDEIKETTFDKPGNWLANSEAFFESELIPGLDEIINLYEDRLCPDLRFQNEFRLGVKAVGCCYGLAKRYQQEQKQQAKFDKVFEDIVSGL
jgi:hypothetical protein